MCIASIMQCYNQQKCGAAIAIKLHSLLSNFVYTINDEWVVMEIFAHQV